MTRYHRCGRAHAIPDLGGGKQPWSRIERKVPTGLPVMGEPFDAAADEPMSSSSHSSPAPGRFLTRCCLPSSQVFPCPTPAVRRRRWSSSRGSTLASAREEGRQLRQQPRSASCSSPVKARTLAEVAHRDIDRAVMGSVDNRAGESPIRLLPRLQAGSHAHGHRRRWRGAPIRVACGYCGSEHNYRGRSASSRRPADLRIDVAERRREAPRRARAVQTVPLVSDRERTGPP